MPPKYISTTTELEWSDADFAMYPWLKRKIRYYSLGKHLGAGSFGDAYEGYPLTGPNCAKVVLGAPKIVVKVPKMDLEGRPKAKIIERLNYVREKNRNEFVYLRKRLEGSAHANPILDLANVFEGGYELPVTIQLFLTGALNLDTWLVRKKYRSPTATTTSVPWHGVADRLAWLSIALPIATALDDTHRHRVRHGDIHPGNIFISLQKPYHATLIDFGEGFLATPDLNSRFRHPKPYLAPERLRTRIPLNEQIDVYSFGILLLYLATGTPTQFDHEGRIGRHRSYIQELISKVNPPLVSHEPRISDLIGRSTALDPADRPRMIEICDDLRQIATSSGATISAQNSRASGVAVLAQYAAELERIDTSHNPILLSLLDQQIRELSNVFAGLQTEMVELYGSRNQMLRVLISLMDHLEEGDSWTTATTLNPWQHNALGLNGSFMSANIRAIRRGVAVRRTFVVSIAELGVEYAEKVAALLADAADPALKKLSNLFQVAIKKHLLDRTDDNYIPPGRTFVEWHRERLRLITEWLNEFFTTWDLGSYINRDRAIKLQESSGVFFGLCPVATLDDVNAKREENPLSLMHFPKKDASQQWLLVAAEQRGRSDTNGVEQSHLIGVRVYKSIRTETGRPNDRIRYLEALMNEEAVNITAATEQLAEIISKAQRELL